MFCYDALINPSINMFKSITNNLSVKLICLALAVILWIFVINESYKVDYLDKALPIEFRNTPENMTIVEDLEEVRLRLRAQENIWQKLSEEDFSVYIDLQGLSRGKHELNIKVISFNPNVQILNYTPSKVKITLEPVVSKKFSVSVETRGSLGEGYVKGEIRTNVSEVQVSGADSIINSIEKVVALVEFNGEMSEIEKTIALKAFNKDGNEVTKVKFEPNSTEVIIQVARESNTKSVGIKPNITGNPATGFWVQKVEINPSVVLVKGKSEDINKIDFLDSQQMDISGISSYTERIVELVAPANVEIEPQSVIIKVSLSSQEIVRSINTILNFQNLQAGLNVKFYSPSEVYVTVKGDASVIESLTKSNILVNIDCFEKGPGTYNIDLNKNMVSTPEGVEVVGVDVDKLQVVIGK